MINFILGLIVMYVIVEMGGLPFIQEYLNELFQKIEIFNKEKE